MGWWQCTECIFATNSSIQAKAHAHLTEHRVVEDME